MVIRQFFQISFALAVLCVIPAAPALPCTRGGWRRWRRWNAFRRRRRSMHSGSSFSAGHSYSGQHSGNWSQGNFSHSGNANWSNGSHSQNSNRCTMPTAAETGGITIGIITSMGGYWGPGWMVGVGAGVGDIRSGSRIGAAIRLAGADIVPTTSVPTARSMRRVSGGRLQLLLPRRRPICRELCSRARRSRPTIPNRRPTTARQRPTRVFSITTKPGLHSRGAIIAMHCGWPATRRWNRRRMRRSTS